MLYESIHKKTTRFGVGLTCGDACRGVDAALVRMKGSGLSQVVKIVKTKHFSYAPGLRTRLLVPRKDAREVALLNYEMGEFLAECTAEMQRLVSQDLIEVDFVASAGHTVAHCPPRGYDVALGTLQIGEPAVIAERTGLPVASDFQGRDLAAGGQGGPITAYGDWVLLARDDRTTVHLHLGGNTRITVIPPNYEDTIAFDVGPGMIAMDGAISLLSSGNTDMDKNGAHAAKGVVMDEFLDYLLDHPYFGRVPPKTIAYHEFGPENYLRDALTGRKDNSLDDLMATVTAAVSYSVVRAFNRFVKPQFNVSRVVVSGGGTQNAALMQRLRNGLGDTTLRVTDEYKLPHNFVDAVAVALLGNEAMSGHESNVPSATGAQRAVVLGRITPV